MKHLVAVNKYFWKYKSRLFLGILFIVLSNYFRILSPQVSGYVVDKVTQAIQIKNGLAVTHHGRNLNYDGLVKQLVSWVEDSHTSFGRMVVYSGITLLILALLGGFFMFLMRQTIIVMSRHIEYEQKNEVYTHYQQLDAGFYKTHSTGDLMNRISEDISRVRMYTGPAVMYVINLLATIGFSVFYMWKENAELTLYVLAPLPILAITIYSVNTVIHRKSERIQALLSNLTTTAQESYSGIRVIKSFVQEKAMLLFFNSNSEEYKKNAISLAKLEAVYFPSMALLIGISTLLTIAIGGWYHASGHVPTVSAGTITEFVIYVNLLTFPVSAIGWTASMIQRAAASQKRLNEFLETKSLIVETSPQSDLTPALLEVRGSKNKGEGQESTTSLNGDIVFENVSFTYAHTGINAIQHFSLTIKEGQKVLVIGKTGSGKSTLAQLLLRFYNPDEGNISIGGKQLNQIPLKQLREEISYVPQDVFLFSDTVTNNIGFGLSEKPSQDAVEQAAKFASIHKEILGFENQYETMIGERGVTLSGGQKQRISIARSLIKNPEIVVFDDCLSAVDAKTESEIINNLYQYLQRKTAIIITHRIFSTFRFDNIIIFENGAIAEQGNHAELMGKKGYYAELYQLQLTREQPEEVME
ncbi:ABC transporter ATP-binding protein [Parasediminibacterium sp. JCM 36343]|uniref:ABC transporter ATP-binding protein n=1 Tax=Parasediminibacterium sp. JCM 36343 TaxID=3374279 RepID=UPI00397AED5F